MLNRLVVLTCAATFFAGCAAFQGQGPGAPDPLVTAMGDLGVGCAVIPIEFPNDAPKARLAVSCASALFGGASIDLAAVAACAESAGVPPQYQALVGLVLSRVQARVGGGSILKTGSTGSEAVRAFLSVCSIGLGSETPTRALRSAQRR